MTFLSPHNFRFIGILMPEVDSQRVQDFLKCFWDRKWPIPANSTLTVIYCYHFFLLSLSKQTGLFSIIIRLNRSDMCVFVAGFFLVTNRSFTDALSSAHIPPFLHIESTVHQKLNCHLHWIICAYLMRYADSPLSHYMSWYRGSSCLRYLHRLIRCSRLFFQ